MSDSDLRVWDLECEAAPEDIGAFMRAEEDAVFYRRADGSEGMAPADCVAVRRMAPGVALARAYIDASRDAAPFSVGDTVIIRSGRLAGRVGTVVSGSSVTRVAFPDGTTGAFWYEDLGPALEGGGSSV